MKIAIACDHGGYRLKETLIPHLESLGHQVEDFGCHSEESIDYPDYAFPAAEAVASGACERGIVICTTGIGVSVCANKVRGIRCALCTDTFDADLTRRHNNSNMLALGQRIVEPALAKEIVSVWLATDFEGGRHQRRIDKISDYENKH